MSLPANKYKIDSVISLLQEIEEERLTNAFFMINVSFDRSNKIEKKDLLNKLRDLNALQIISSTTFDDRETVGTWQIELDEDYESVRDSYYNFKASDLKVLNYDYDGKILNFSNIQISIRGINQVRLCETLFINRLTDTKMGVDEILDDWNLKGEDFDTTKKENLRKPRDAAINLNSKIFHESQGKVIEFLLTKDSSVEINPNYI